MYREQLQFNLNSPPRRDNLQTTIQKPRPITIEKLAPSKAPEPKMQRPSSSNSVELSSLSSERLEFAMQLAKRDVKKLKTMLSDPSIQIPDILYHRSNNNQAVLTEQPNAEHQKPVAHSKVSASHPKKDKTPNVGKILSAKKPPKDVNYKNGQLKFIQYDENEDADVNNEKLQGKEVTEIKRLRKELQKYMKRLDSVLDEKGSNFQNQPKGVKHLVDDGTEKERKRVRVEEQASRSARVLYMLQRKVQEIQDELEKQDGHVKHTHKSQHLTRLAAAHRSAVRALQMFVNQAPLYFDVKHGLPPMYHELALLIQQLSLLSSQLHVGKDIPDFNMDLLPKTKKLISNWNNDVPNKGISDEKKLKNQGQRKMKKPEATKQHLKQVNKHSFLDQHADWIRDKARDIGIDDVTENSTASNEPTPEREAVLKAGLDALKRARESSSFVATDIKHKPSGVSFQIPKSTAVSKRRPKSVLFPHQIKKQRYHPVSVKPKVKASRALQEPAQPMHFAKQTVASILKKQDEIKYEPKKRFPLSPRQMQSHDESFTAYETPRQRDEQILQHVSPPSKKNIPRSAVSPEAVRSLNYWGTDSLHDNRKSPNYERAKSPRYDRRIMEKEVARQAWLDRERERELQRLEDLRATEAVHLTGLRQEYVNSQKMINEAEEKIKQTLQPLIEKGEFISHQEKVRHDQYKQSVRRRLGEIVTDTAMSKGEILAEMILDDILMETVYELQRIEEEEAAEGNAVFQSEKPTIEAVKQKLEQFEKEEDEIRRRWKAFHYSELETANQSKHIAKGVTGAVSAKPIVFTAVSSQDKRLEANQQTNTLASDKANVPQSSKVIFPSRCQETVPIFVPDQMRKSIMAYKGTYDDYLNKTMTEKHGKFNPCKLIERISEDILEDVIIQVGNELDNICDDYVETIYADEFVRNDSLISQTSNDTVTKDNSN